MRDKDEIARLMEQIQDDPRFDAENPADVRINSPLALQQTAMATALDTLVWVLGERDSAGLGLWEGDA